ncbi:collagen pro alpha-chain precursor [Pseudomonas fluorescens]|uniref:Collagen-like triple helix repeat-containing protein n=1 Tax=Pseudomonas lactucae TaxID=2813360 RepID=A0A9X0YC57_9PSED|nr:collagen-like triple helix repeat-containing protein [Pseudomonas lactucae]OPA96250.1 collagen pro alpha-chain precursor [Pseudomonas fluorescens]MBN2976695.1 collagen-like triple helix repeat-containing protein [Pseudomonas lactucae]MBN2986305.1 collagen-like triple helix repeat-containing protein [Pseudomonas lactucae]OPB12629.1 collagen pro alpha-chain precursor [Pseudomonas fluorescens]OPB26376.1 collagen pro alpha-chain precursor [Pseudomonas fluorescens]
MRKVFLLALLVSPVALAQSVRVETNSLMRLPSSTSVLQLERLDVADYGTLLIPSSISQVTVDELHLGRDARIAIVPGNTALQLQVSQAQLEHGSQITSRGAPGTHEKPAKPGRDLTLRINNLTAEELSVDARGGAGAQGYSGLDGANGEDPGCTWGSAGRGFNGDNGGDGLPGAAGAQVRVELPKEFPAQQIKVWVEGGAGGLPGTAGKPGKGGESKGCLVYRADGGEKGRPGLEGQPGPVGPAGSVTIQRL